MLRSMSLFLFLLMCFIAIGAVPQSKERESLAPQANEQWNNENLDGSKSHVTKIFYVGSFFKTTWHMASKYCRHRGMLLASINSEKEQHDLEATIDRYGALDLEYLWISGTSVNETGTYFWNNSRNRTPVTYSKWLKGYPTGSTSQSFCILMGQKEGGYGWLNYGCTSNYYFVCEISDFSAYSEHCLNKALL